MRGWILGGIVLLLWAGLACRGGGRPGAATPEAALTALAGLAAEPARLFDLLDQTSRWSVMSALRDQQKICELVRAQYPKERQARELGRCRAAETARQPNDFFATVARAEGLLAGLQGLTGKEPLTGSGDRRQAAGPKGTLLFCEEAGSWGYCGLREPLERLKLKAARDLAVVQENAEAYKGR